VVSQSNEIATATITVQKDANANYFPTFSESPSNLTFGIQCSFMNPYGGCELPAGTNSDTLTFYKISGASNTTPLQQETVFIVTPMGTASGDCNGAPSTCNIPGPSASLDVLPAILSLETPTVIPAGSSTLVQGGLNAPPQSAECQGSSCYGEIWLQTTDSGLTFKSTVDGGTFIQIPTSSQFGGAGSTTGTIYFNTDWVTQPTQATINGTYIVSGAEPTAQWNVTISPAGTELDLADCACDNTAGAPINLANGNGWIKQTDYSLPGLGGGITVERTWNSLWTTVGGAVQQAGMFGDSWRSTYEERLQIVSSNTVRYWKADGSSWVFSGSSGSYTIAAPYNVNASLSYSSSTLLYTMTLVDGSQKIFNAAGSLTSIIDRNGNQTNISYDSSHRITQVTDAANRSITFTYGDATNPNQTTSLQDSVGTIASYAYDSSSHLSKVTYADNSAYQFSYDANGQFWALRMFREKQLNLTPMTARGVH
jgi:YD repeat-containing protein